MNEHNAIISESFLEAARILVETAYNVKINGITDDTAASVESVISSLKILRSALN